MVKPIYLQGSVELCRAPDGIGAANQGEPTHLSDPQLGLFGRLSDEQIPG